MEFKLLVVALSVVSLSAVFGFKVDSESFEDEERGGFPRRIVQEQRRFLNEKFAEVLDSIESILIAELKPIKEVVDSIQRRQKLQEFCTEGICGENGTCALSEDEETYVCHCEETHVGEHCEITGICNIDLYNAQQEPLMLGREFPRCDEDGTYAGMQYMGTMAYCVTSENVELPYSVQRWQTGDDMNCQCARDEYANTVPGKDFKCLNNGNYRMVECNNTSCWCLDSMGQRYGDDVDIGDLDTTLNC